MKKILLLSSILFMFSCKEEQVETEPVTTDWKIEIKYLDKTVDTLVIRSIEPPYLWVDDHVSVVRVDNSYRPYASYVKTINILNQN